MIEHSAQSDKLWKTLGALTAHFGHMTTLGSYFATARQSRGLTQRDVAIKLGTTDQTISRMEVGTTNKPPNTWAPYIGALVTTPNPPRPLLRDELETFVSLGVDRYLISGYAAPDIIALEGTRRECKVLLDMLLDGIDPLSVGYVLQALLELRKAKPMARHIPMSDLPHGVKSVPTPAPGPTYRPIDTSLIPPASPPPPPELPETPMSAAEMREAGVETRRIPTSEGPMPEVPGARALYYKAITDISDQLAESLDLPPDRVAAAIRRALNG